MGSDEPAPGEPGLLAGDLLLQDGGREGLPDAKRPRHPPARVGAPRRANDGRYVAAADAGVPVAPRVVVRPEQARQRLEQPGSAVAKSPGLDGAVPTYGQALSTRPIGRADAAPERTR